MIVLMTSKSSKCGEKCERLLFILYFYNDGEWNVYDPI